MRIRYMWIAGRDRYVGEWSQSGAVGEISCGGYWYATADKEEWPEPGTEPYEMLMADFDGEELCDRRQEIVFIGQKLDRAAITAALDACQVKRGELPRKPGSGEASGSEEHGWKFDLHFPKDPFGLWETGVVEEIE